VCGKEIEAQRLKAVPWTSLCREDQERADQRRSASYAQGGAPSRVA
jgi:RNA polymerase-binding transcription factor DksA